MGRKNPRHVPKKANKTQRNRSSSASTASSSGEKRKPKKRVAKTTTKKNVVDSSASFSLETSSPASEITPVGRASRRTTSTYSELKNGRGNPQHTLKNAGTPRTPSERIRTRASTNNSSPVKSPATYTVEKKSTGTKSPTDDNERVVSPLLVKKLKTAKTTIPKRTTRKSTRALESNESSESIVEITPDTGSVKKSTPIRGKRKSPVDTVSSNSKKVPSRESKVRKNSTSSTPRKRPVTKPLDKSPEESPRLGLSRSLRKRPAPSPCSPLVTRTPRKQDIKSPSKICKVHIEKTLSPSGSGRTPRTLRTRRPTQQPILDASTEEDVFQDVHPKKLTKKSKAVEATEVDVEDQAISKSGAPSCPLPCRDEQFQKIWRFAYENIRTKNSG